jgi:electron transport complex protein RnfB
MAKARRRGRPPKKLAVIHADSCTGCESCIEMCPVDCIALITQELGVKGTEAWCEVDLERCIGCELCVRIPRRRTEPYSLLVCPWEAIEMVPTERAAEVVACSGGPPQYAAEHRNRLIEAAERVAKLRSS